MSWKHPSNQFQSNVKVLVGSALGLVQIALGLFALALLGIGTGWLFGLSAEQIVEENLELSLGFLGLIIICGPIAIFSYFWDADGSRAARMNAKKQQQQEQLEAELRAPKIETFKNTRRKMLTMANQEYCSSMTPAERETFQGRSPWEEQHVTIVLKYGPRPLIQDFGLLKGEDQRAGKYPADFRFELWSARDRKKWMDEALMSNHFFGLDPQKWGEESEFWERIKPTQPDAKFIFDPDE